MMFSVLKSGLPLLIFMVLISCSKGKGALIFEAGNFATSSVTIESPVNLTVMPATDLSAVTVSGTCTRRDEVLTITALTETETAICHNDVWSVTFDLTSWTTGNLMVKATSEESSHSTVVVIDGAGPDSEFATPLTNLTHFGSTQEFTWIAVDTISLLRTTDTYFVEAFANGTCTGVPFASGLQDEDDYTLSPMIDGTTYSVRVSAYDVFDNLGPATCSTSIAIDQTPPTLALTDGTTGSAVYARQLATAASISAATAVKKWCLSESNVQPAITDTCFVSTKPTTLNLSTGDNLKTVYLWVADLNGTILASPVSDTITLDTTLPATPTVTLTGTESLSTSYTNLALNTLAITDDTDATRWCLIEQASATAAPTKPLYNNACFASSRANTHTLAARGTRKLYVFTSDDAGNISAGGVANFDFPVPTAAIVAGPAKIFTHVCSGVVTLTSQDINGLNSPADSALVFTLSDGAGGGVFYSDAGCVTTATTATIGIGSTSATYYYKNTSAGARTLVATAGTIIASHAISVVLPNLVTPGKNGTTCATIDGAAYCWGQNSGTLFGIPNYETTKSTPFAIPTLASTVTQIEAGHDHACAVQNGAVKCWGQGWAGQTGNNSNSPQDTPAIPAGLEAGVTQVATGLFHSCAVKNGAAYCWGWNPYGQVGNGTSTDVLTPALATGLSSGVTKVAVGSHFSCALQNGGVKCWGYNASGSIGDGTFTTRLVPTPVSNMTSGVTDLAIGDFHACAIKSGSVKCWGADWSAQLGDGTQTNSNIPVQVQGLTAGATEVVAGNASGCAVVAGEVWCWASDIHGQRGDGTINNWSGYTVEKITTLTGFERLRAGGNNMCAIFSGVPKCWGVNAGNELGTGSLEASQLPLTARGVTGTTVALSAGNTNCAVSSTGTIQCWGAGDMAQVGDGSVIHRNAPRTVSNIASGATKVSTGKMSACAVQSGGVRCWGRNDESQLGTAGWRIDAPAAYTIASGSSATDVSVSNSGSLVCAVVAGGVKCWGQNNITPTDVTGLGAGSGVTKVSVGDAHACALLSTGAIYCWGKNTSSQIGIGAATANETAHEVIAAGATDVSAAQDFSCAVVTSNLQCWGYSGYGEAGFYGTKTTPFTIASLSGTVSLISSAPFFSCVATTSGTVKCFGRNTDRQLGYTGGDTATPQTVIGLNSVTAISAGNQTACVINSGSMKCWGGNLYGALSDASSVAEPNPMIVVLPADVRTVTVSTPAAVALNTCSAAFTITLSANAAAATSMSLNSSDGIFYPASSSCDVAAITSVSVAMGASTAQFKFRATTSGTKNISAKGARTSRGLATYSVTP
ncbi:MAG: hypothetical protein V4598_17620 [Bdellovibrionota bacterium]